MWILPKNLSDICPYVADMKESELDSEEFSQIASRSLTVKSKFSQSPTWLRRWKRVKFIRLLCSRTLKNSHSESFVDAWTSYLGGSPANLFPKQESETELKTQDTSSHTSSKASKSADPQLSFSKTWKESSHPRQPKEKVFSNMCSDHWKKWVTKQRQEYSQRLKSAHHTRGKESSSWPTPTARDVKGPSGRAYKNKPENLADIELGNWATPNTMDSLPQRSEEALRKQAQGIRKGRKRPSNLREQVDPRAVEIYKEESEMNWPTASVSDPEGGSQADRVEWTAKGARLRKKGKPDVTYGAKLRDAVENLEAQWPTPTVAEAGKIGSNPNYGQLGLSNHPKVHGYELTREKMVKSGKEPDGPQDQTKNSTGGKSKGQFLNPNWVEHLMGLEPQWTQLPTDWID
jgi:hypothetical protein